RDKQDSHTCQNFRNPVSRSLIYHIISNSRLRRYELTQKGTCQSCNSRRPKAKKDRLYCIWKQQMNKELSRSGAISLEILIIGTLSTSNSTVHGISRKWKTRERGQSDLHRFAYTEPENERWSEHKKWNRSQTGQERTNSCRNHIRLRSKKTDGDARRKA